MYLTKRQREILNFVTEFIKAKGYAPSLEEIRRRFGLSSLATVHKHLSNLEEKGLIRRLKHRGRSLELVSMEMEAKAREVPLLGQVAAGSPIEAIEHRETISVPEDMFGRYPTFVLRVKGNSMINEQIRDGDYVLVEDRQMAENGETVIALLRNEEVTLKRFYREGRTIRLQPANPEMEPLILPAEEVTIQGVVIGVLRKYR